MHAYYILQVIRPPTSYSRECNPFRVFFFWVCPYLSSFFYLLDYSTSFEFLICKQVSQSGSHYRLYLSHGVAGAVGPARSFLRSLLPIPQPLTPPRRKGCRRPGSDSSTPGFRMYTRVFTGSVWVLIFFNLPGKQTPM